MTTGDNTVTVKNHYDKTAPYLYLRPAAWSALMYHGALLSKREEVPGDPWRGQPIIDVALEKAAVDPILAALLPLAEQMANTDDPEDRHADYRAAAALLAEHNRLDPLPVYEPVLYDPDDRCRHGHLFTEPCDDCGA